MDYLIKSFSGYCQPVIRILDIICHIESLYPLPIQYIQILVSMIYYQNTQQLSRLQLKMFYIFIITSKRRISQMKTLPRLFLPECNCAGKLCYQTYCESNVYCVCLNIIHSFRKELTEEQSLHNRGTIVQVTINMSITSVETPQG